MGLVIIAAFLQAILFILFRVFQQRHIPLMPAIAVNYVVAMGCGIVHSAPWSAEQCSALWWPSLGTGVLFVLVFFLTGVTAQRAGVAASTVSSKMSVVLTVLFSVFVHQELLVPIGWAGLLLALIGAVLVSWVPGRAKDRARWGLPVALFIGTACIDISINAVQRALLTPETEAIYPTLSLGAAGLLAMLIVLRSNERRALTTMPVWVGGGLLGLINYGTLLFVVRALAHGGMNASITFPLISIGVILFGTFGSFILFKESVDKRQQIGIACAVVALAFLMLSA